MAFTNDTFAFLKALEAHSSKQWFDDHRAEYEAHWKEPALAFIDAIAPEIAERGLKAEARVNGSLRRINRDVRFSKDKSPYNARLHLIFWTGMHPNKSPGMHFVLTPSGIGYGAGQFGMEPKTLAVFRDRVVEKADGDALIAALEKAQKVGCEMGKPDLVRLPKGYDAEGRRADLLRYKAIVARTHEREADAGKIIGEGATDWALKMTDALMPLLRWLRD
jgi:uncharacterized protein (TIGR02453 family)